MKQAIIKFYKKDHVLTIDNVVNIAETNMLTIYSGSDDDPCSAVYMFNYKDIERVLWCEKAESEDKE